MKRHVLRLVGIAALAGGGLLAFGAPVQAEQVPAGYPGVVTGHGFASVVQTPMGTCGNAVAVDGVAIIGCDGGAIAVSNGDSSWVWADVDGNDTIASILRSRTWS
jgi:hypothetical protein